MTWAEVKAERFRLNPFCDKCKVNPAIEAHHVLVPDYKQYRPWVHNLVNCQGLCLGGCHTPGNYEGRVEWANRQDKAALLEWLDAAPYEARYRVAEVRRMCNA